MARDERPDLSLSVEIRTSTGSTYRLDPSARDPRDRPQGINWRTKLGEGFSDGGLGLSRRVTDDYPDLGLVDIWTVVDANGQVVYQGRLEAQPRTLDDRHSIGITLVGLAADLKRRQFREVYVDRSMSSWGDMPLNEKARLATGGRDFGSFSWAANGDGLAVGLPNQALGAQVQAGSWYVAPPGVTVAKVVYRGTETSIPAGWLAARFVFHETDFQTVSSVGHTITLDDTLRSVTPTTSRRYVSTDAYSNGTAATPAAGAQRSFSKIAVYGNHGRTLYNPITAGEPQGVRVTDAFKDIIIRWCPTLDASNIGTSSYVIPHLVFADPTYPYDAVLELNKYLQWKLAVWEDGRVMFEPHDLSDYTWQARTDDPNVSLEWQGPTTETTFSGAHVTYTDLLTGREQELTPDTRGDLRETNPENPFNKWGIEQWLPVQISTPQLADDAAQIGIAALGEANRPKAPGVFTIRQHVRDRAGDWQPAHHVRAGDTIALTDHPNDAPRLVTETSYEQDSGTLRVSVDAPPNLLEAFFDRVDVELQAGGLR